MRTVFASLATRTTVTEIPGSGVLVSRFVAGNVSQEFVPGGDQIPAKHFAGPSEKETNDY